MSLKPDPDRNHPIGGPRIPVEYAIRSEDKPNFLCGQAAASGDVRRIETERRISS